MSNNEQLGFTEAFKTRLNEIRKIIDDDRFRKRVLVLCQQTEPRSFDEYSSSGSFRKLEKFESSTYSEVLKAIDLADNNKPVVMKIMRALSKGVIKRMPSAATKGSQSYNDILNELVVTQALSQLHDGVILSGKSQSLYRTHFFCLIHEIKVVSGNLEKTLSKSRIDTAVGQTPINIARDEDKRDGEDARVFEIKDEDLKNLSEDDRMLMEALPFEYVVSVMRHDGQPLWWMMKHKKLTAEQFTSILVQIIVGIAIAEKVYQYEHRDLHVSNILIKKTSKDVIPFVLNGNGYTIVSHGIKATIIDATFSRLTHNGKVYYRDLTSTLRAYGTKKTPTRMSLQNRSYRQMVHITKNNWEEFTPKTNLTWLTYLCETLMKNEILKNNSKLLGEIDKIRDFTLKVNNTLDLLCHFPFDQDKTNANVLVNKQTSIKSVGKVIVAKVLQVAKLSAKDQEDSKGTVKNTNSSNNSNYLPSTVSGASSPLSQLSNTSASTHVNQNTKVTKSNNKK